VGNEGKSGLPGSLVGGCAWALVIPIVKNKENVMKIFFIYLIPFPELSNIFWGLIFKNFDGKDNILF